MPTPSSLRRTAGPVSCGLFSTVATVALVALTTLALPLRTAAAHPLDLGYLRLDAQPGSVAAGLDLDLAAAAHLLAVEESALAADAGAALSRHAAALADATLRRLPITSDLGDCTWQPDAFASLAARTVSVTARAECPSPAKELRWALPFIAESRVSPTFQLLVKAHVAAETLVTTLDRNLVELTLPLGDASAAAWGFTDFVWSGVEHIGAAPEQWHDASGWKLPDGLDHILFLLALLLAGGRALQLVGIASGFTLGHSITLALSALGVVRPPAEVIEPLIALSIALVAAEAFLARPGNRRWKMATAFGLVHGFGFAGALGELGLTTAQTAKALVGYNLGVELGQIAIVLAVAPLILLLSRRPTAHRVVVRALSATIFVAGLYWFVQRALGSM
jgi:HupE / UreJ protein